HRLLNNVKVQAIIGQETQIQSTLLALYADRAKVPIFSFVVSSLMEYPYSFKLKEGNFVREKSVASLMELYKGMNVTFVYEDNDDGREILPYLVADTLYLNTPRGASLVVETDKEVKEFLFGLLDIPLVNLDTSLKNYVNEPFDISSVPREVKSQPLAEKKYV
nr:extracellular ligand-binding receptor [Tanacetum cinerariifolium]